MVVKVISEEYIFFEAGGGNYFLKTCRGAYIDKL